MMTMTMMMIMMFCIEPVYTRLLTTTVQVNLGCVSRLPIDFCSPFNPFLCIFSEQTKTFHFLSNSIPPCLSSYHLSNNNNNNNNNNDNFYGAITHTNRFKGSIPNSSIVTAPNTVNCCTTFDPVSFIFTFHKSKPS